MRLFDLYKTLRAVRRTKLKLKLLKKARSSQILRLARALQIVREERRKAESVHRLWFLMLRGPRSSLAFSECLIAASRDKMMRKRGKQQKKPNC